MESPGDEYGAIAFLYDPATAWALDPLRRELAGAVAREPAGRVLDVCCGTGRQCLMYAGTGREAVGVDLSPGMIRRAARLGRDGNVTIRAIQGDARNLPFPDDSFAAATIALALHEKPHHMRPAILDEMLRVTVPGGLIAVADYLAPRTASQSALSWGVKTVERMAGREHHAHYVHFMAHGGLEGMLEQHGLLPAEIMPHVFGLIGLALARRPG